MAQQVDLSTDELFARIGRMLMQLQKQDELLVAKNAQNAELARVAGESLRALEALGRKDIADAIIEQKGWSRLMEPAPAEEEAPTLVVE